MSNSPRRAGGYRFRRGGGARWLDLMSTLGGRYRAERDESLRDPAALTAWFAESGLPLGRPATAEELAVTIAVREALHAVTRAVVGGDAVDDVDVRVINRVLTTDTGLQLTAGDGDALGLSAIPPATATAALARVVREAVDDLLGPAGDRLHPCGDASCSGYFLDGTGRRRWCSDERCGNRLRVRAHRERARAAADV